MVGGVIADLRNEGVAKCRIWGRQGVVEVIADLTVEGLENVIV